MINKKLILKRVGAMVFQGRIASRETEHDHSQTVAITTASGGWAPWSGHGSQLCCAGLVLWLVDTTGCPW